MPEFIDIQPRNHAQKAVMELFIAEMGGDKEAALSEYLNKYAPRFDDVFVGHEHDAPQDLLHALHEKVDTIH